MGLFYKKDEFGYKSVKKRSVISCITVFLVLSFITLTDCTCTSENVDAGILEVLEFENPEVKEPPVIIYCKPIIDQTKKQFVKYIWRLEYRFSKTRYTTCYTKHDEGDPGHGVYANQNFASKLHLYERRIRYEHNTVALCPEDKRYHEELIQMSDGTWTHKWRVHINGVHKPDITELTDSGYFGVPRDRMMQSGRIDYLITQAGKYKDMERRVKNWKSLNRKIDFWEWTKYKLYSDGSKERVK